jgi:hypothetical protein
MEFIMIMFFVPNDVPDNLKDLNAMVRPPNWKKSRKIGYTSIDDRIDFMSALTRAIIFVDRFRSTKLLDGLKALYPDAVASRLPEAETKARKTRSSSGTKVAVMA